MPFALISGSFGRRAPGLWVGIRLHRRRTRLCRGESTNRDGNLFVADDGGSTCVLDGESFHVTACHSPNARNFVLLATAERGHWRITAST